MSDATDSASEAGQLQPGETCSQQDGEGQAVEVTDPRVVDDDAEFKTDLEAAIAEGKVFAVSEADFNTRVAALIPKLAKVRKHTAQRQEDYVKGRRKGAPKWGHILKLFRAETGVTLCDKTIKRLIDEVEGIKPAPRTKTQRTKMIPPSLQKKMGLALIAVQEMLENVSEQGTVILKQEDIAVIRRMLPSAQVLERLVSNMPEESESAPTSNVLSEASASLPDPTSGSLENLQLRLSALKAGDGAGLANAINDNFSPLLKAVFGGLPPDSLAASVDSFAQVFLDTFRTPGTGRYTRRTLHIPIKPKAKSSGATAQRPQNPSLFDIAAPGSQLAQ